MRPSRRPETRARRRCSRPRRLRLGAGFTTFWRPCSERFRRSPRAPERVRVPSRITLLTDFGTRDGYVGALKGVLASAAPGALLDDISHDIVRGDVRGAQYALARYWRLFPEGTVHLAVVDPGVGTSRR